MDLMQQANEVVIVNRELKAVTKVLEKKQLIVRRLIKDKDEVEFEEVDG
jgi:hypothetical protein